MRKVLRAKHLHNGTHAKPTSLAQHWRTKFELTIFLVTIVFAQSSDTCFPCSQFPHLSYILFMSTSFAHLKDRCFTSTAFAHISETCFTNTA